MSAATVGRDPLRKESDLVAYPVLASTKIYKGTLVSLTSAGYAIPARSGTNTDVFIGVADQTVDNTAGASAALKIKVRKVGTFVFAKGTAVAADIGVAFYASDDSTVTATSTNNQLVGYACELIDSANLRIRIDNAVH